MDKKIKQAMDKAYKEAGSNAYFANGFYTGYEFANKRIEELEEGLKEIEKLLTYPAHVLTIAEESRLVVKSRTIIKKLLESEAKK